MPKLNGIQKLYKPVLALLLFGLLLSPYTAVFAQSSTTSTPTTPSVLKKSDLDLDSALIVEDDSFVQPESVEVMPIFLPAELKLNYRDWYKGLFYYLSSDRYNFKDIPFHYVIDKNGQLYEGVNGGVERQAIIKNGGRNPIVVVYLADRADNDFGANAIKPLEDLLVKIANDSALRPDKFRLHGLKLEKDSAQKIVNLTADNLFGSWGLTFERLLQTVAAKYSPTVNRYNVRIVSLESPQTALQPGAEAAFKIKIKNEGDRSIFADGDSELILSTTSGRDSAMFLNNVWLSRSQIGIMPDGAVLRPGKEATYDFKVMAPFNFGKSSDVFYLRTAGGQEFRNQTVTPTIEVSRGNLKILEVTQSETSFVRVRQSTSSSSAEIGRVSPGQRFIWTENSNGWYRIKFDGKEGWILAKYVRVL